MNPKTIAALAWEGFLQIGLGVIWTHPAGANPANVRTRSLGMDGPEGYQFPESPEARAIRLEAESNVHYLRRLIENTRLGSDGDAATLRILLAKVAGKLPVIDMLRLAESMLAIAIDEAERRPVGDKPAAIAAAGIAERIYRGGQGPGPARVVA